VCSIKEQYHEANSSRSTRHLNLHLISFASIESEAHEIDELCKEAECRVRKAGIASTSIL
jgi:hypothetical protein